MFMTPVILKLSRYTTSKIQITDIQSSDVEFERRLALNKKRGAYHVLIRVNVTRHNPSKAFRSINISPV